MRKTPSFLFLLSLLVSCLPIPVERPAQTKTAAFVHPWAETLRALDPADTASPAHDLTAVYLRQAGDQLQIRIDLLDFQSANDLSLDVNIIDASSPDAPLLTIHVPSEDASAHITLDPQLATVHIDVPSSEIPSQPRVDVSTPEDAITDLTLDGPVQTQTAPLLLTFYDTFAARFPAEALRSWDGAHTGPRGERHGLKHLLDAVEVQKAPIVLLDLKEPENLSALEAMGGLPQIRRLEQEGLLLLPDVAGEEVRFGFPPSPFSWNEIISRSTYVFAPVNDPSHLYQPLFNKTIYIPLARQKEAAQPTPDGPSLEVRRGLLEIALNEDDTDLLVLGGSLRESTWGSPELAGAMMAYFASRSYIQILSGEDLLAYPTERGKPELGSLPKDEALHELEAHYRTLTDPVLEFVAHWQGSSLSSCNSDLDKDGHPECILANDENLAILDPQGARLTYLFTGRRDSISPYLQQLVGPSWQVAVGFSNPSLWDLSAGEAADPGAYPGAFADTDGPFKPYEPAVAGNSIVFTSRDGRRTKTFKLTDTGIEVGYHTQEPAITQISLLVEPDARFTSGWADKYVQEKTPGRIAWGLENGPMVSVQAPGAALSLPKGQGTMRAFNESLSLLSAPEDPDFDYPPGHYIPFPMAVVEAEVQDGYFFRLERLP